METIWEMKFWWISQQFRKSDFFWWQGEFMVLQIQKYFVVRERFNKRDNLTSWSLGVFSNFCNGLWVRILPSYGENLNNQEIEKVTRVRSVFKWVTQMSVVAAYWLAINQVRGGGLVVSILAFYSADPSLNPAD